MIKGSNNANALIELLAVAEREKAKRVYVQESCQNHCVSQTL
jgi:hypothetical protein